MSTRLSGSDRRRHIEELIQRLSETDEALQALGAGEVDAVVDPASAAPILLSRAQKALADSEARYRDLISRCPALVCEIAPDGETIFVNEAIRTLLGYEPEELIGHSWWERLVPIEHTVVVQFYFADDRFLCCEGKPICWPDCLARADGFSSH